MTQPSHKTCSICGVNFPLDEFAYANRENRSYCNACDKGEKAAYAVGGAEAARRFRDEKRSIWKGSPKPLMTGADGRSCCQ